MSFTRSELVNLLHTAGNLEALPASLLKGRWPDYELFAAIALKESGGEPLKYNSDDNRRIDRGLWQINSVHEKWLLELFREAKGDFRTACYTPIVNALFAVAVFQKQGYEAWSSFNRLP